MARGRDPADGTLRTRPARKPVGRTCCTMGAPCPRRPTQLPPQLRPQLPLAFAEDSDEALMLSYAAGRAAAFDTLYARHKGGVYRYLLRHCGNAGIADELFQDVWMNAIRARDRYAPTAKFTTWLYTLAHHRLVDHWRASGQAKFASIDDDDDEGTRAAVEALPASRREEPEARIGRAAAARTSCTRRWPRSLPCSATRSCCSTRAACRSRKSRS